MVMEQKIISKTVIFYAGSDYYHHPHHHKELHCLESCYLCQKTLGVNNDIFMYRGNAPFCSEECREDQIEIDEDKERVRRKISGSNSKRIIGSFREISSDQKLADKSLSIKTKDVVRTDTVYVT